MAILRTLKPTFTGGEYSPALNARVDLEKYSTGLKKATNVFVHPHGGVSNRAGFEHVRYVRQGGLSVQIPFVVDTETGETYTVILADQRMTFSRDGAPVLEDEVTGTTNAPDGADALFTKVSHGFADEDYLVWQDVTAPLMHQRVFRVDVVSVDTFKLLTMDGTTLPNAEVTNSGYGLRRHYTVVSPYLEADVREVTFAQDNDVMYMAHKNHAPRKLSRLGETNWTLDTLTFVPVAVAPTNLQGTVTNGTGHDPNLEEPATYVVATISADTGEESLPSASVTLDNDLNIEGAKNTLTWTAATGNVDRYVVYKDTEGVFGFIGATKTTSFVDRNIVETTSDGPQDAFNPFDAAGRYPRAVTLHEQRLTFASLIDDPQAVFTSQTSILENFGSASPAKADDAITFRMRARDRQYVYALVSTASGLAVFTSSTEWMVTGGSEDYLTPTNVSARPQTHRGSRFLPPLLVGDVVMYAQARGGVVRDFSYSFENDTFNGPDRTILARHLFEHRKIVSWCYAQSPYSIVWVVMDDGALLSLTYLREHDVWGWTTHEIDGTVDSVVSIPEEDEDAVYITVRRTIDGTEYAFQERMASRRVQDRDDWFFVDAGLRYEGVPTQTVSGLHHLNGATVTILADGNELPDDVVADGQLDLGHEYSNVVVGLRYTAEVETMDLDLGNLKDIGVVQGREVAMPGLVVHVEHTRGLWTGRDRDHMNEWKQRATEDYGAAILPFTGKFTQDFDPDWDNTGNIVLQQRGPLPMTVLSVAPDVAVGG